MFTGILYTHIFYALGGSEMPNGQNLRPIAAGSRRPAWIVSQYQSVLTKLYNTAQYSKMYPKQHHRLTYRIHGCTGHTTPFETHLRILLGKPHHRVQFLAPVFQPSNWR